MPKEKVLPVFLFLLAAVLLTVRLAHVPPLWWDEGWVLSLARNWIELGQYALLRDGEPIPPTILNTGLPFVGAVALSFRLLGVGIWQGRLPGVLFSLGALALIYHLAKRLYDRTIAIVTLGVLLMPPGATGLHPVLAGRQVIGEMAALFYLLAGYLSFLFAWRRPRLGLLLASCFWGLALHTKTQVLPFLAVSLLLPLAAMAMRRRYQPVWLLAAGLSGSFIAFLLFTWAQELLLGGTRLVDGRPHVVYDVLKDPASLFTYVLAPVSSLRINVLIGMVSISSVLLISLIYGGRSIWLDIRTVPVDARRLTLQLALFTLTSGWYLWWGLISIGFSRYLFPATFLGSIFVAILAVDLGRRFRSPARPDEPSRPLWSWRCGLRTRSVLLTGVLIVWMIPTASVLYWIFIADADASVERAAEFLNHETSPAAMVETYDSELFFLLNRRYHYPKNSVQTQLARRTYFGQGDEVDYDALATNPDYLVVGPQSRLWELYNPVLEAGHFRLIKQYGKYAVYERKRCRGPARRGGLYSQ